MKTASKNSIEPTVVYLKPDVAEFSVEIKETGRYEITVFGSQDSVSQIWIEDYINNKDQRTYNITGSLDLNKEGTGKITGSPLAAKMHQMKVHVEKGTYIDSISFKLITLHVQTPKVLSQEMTGDNWDLVWSDEFDGDGLVDYSKWSYNAGNWGWGNNELQYYTAEDLKNARQENGVLIIEAHKNENNRYWSS